MWRRKLTLANAETWLVTNKLALSRDTANQLRAPRLSSPARYESRRFLQPQRYPTCIAAARPVPTQTFSGQLSGAFCLDISVVNDGYRSDIASTLVCLTHDYVSNWHIDCCRHASGTAINIRDFSHCPSRAMCKFAAISASRGRQRRVSSFILPSLRTTNGPLFRVALYGSVASCRRDHNHLHESTL